VSIDVFCEHAQPKRFVVLTALTTPWPHRSIAWNDLGVRDSTINQNQHNKQELGRRTHEAIAVEISVTTGTDHELGNIEKCIAAGYKEILFVSGKERHARSLARAIKERIDEETQANISISYASPETLGTFLESLGETIPPSETEVAGYKVKTTRKAPPPEEAARRRAVIADVVARAIATTG
jgi:hypothetical protein